MKSATSIYRNDVDGLRAVAVVSVLIYHAFPHWLPGGFTGVDVFFVISGFVITHANMVAIRGGRFSWLDFMQRRFRRLLPALLLVLAACLVAGHLAMLPEDYSRLGASAVSAVLFVPNLLLWHEAGYFDVASNAKPLLHLWSLGVEEQFYLFWSVIVLICFRPRYLALAVFAAGLASCGYCIWVTSHDPVAAFYSPLSRLWEPAVGCLLALWSVRGAGRSGHLMSILGGVGLLCAVLTIRAEGFPGAIALLPVGAAALLIAAGPQSVLNRWVLSFRPLVYLGRISYPTYLWHWPILVFAEHVLGLNLGTTALVCLLLLSVLLAAGTYHLIELPLKTHFTTGFVARRSIALAGVVGIAGLAVHSSGGAWRFPDDVRQVLAYQTYEFQTDARYPACWLSENTPFSEIAPECLLTGGAGPSLAIWGDSHAARLYPGLSQSAHFEIAQFTRNGCLPLLRVGNDGCALGNRAVLEEIRRAPPDEVLLFGAWYNHDGWDGRLLDELDQTIAAIQDAGVQRIVLLGSSFNFVRGLPRMTFEHWKRHGVLPDRLPGDPDGRLASIDDRLAAVAARRGVSFISLRELLCRDDQCLAYVPRTTHKLMTWDYGHLTTEGAIWVTRELLKARKLKSH